MLFGLLSIIITSLFVVWKIMRDKNWYLLLGIVIFYILMVATTYYSIKGQPYSLRGIDRNLHQLFLFLTMILGMEANPVFKGIKNQKLNLSLIELVKPLLVAPIIFMSIWGLIEKMSSITFITYCFSFQNGFFWECILKKYIK